MQQTLSIIVKMCASGLSILTLSHQGKKYENTNFKIYIFLCPHMLFQLH